MMKYTRFDGNGKEGLGSILQSQLHLYAYCKINKFDPCMIKLKNISHFQYSGLDSESYDLLLNSYFNFLCEESPNGEFVDPTWLIRDWGEKNNESKKEIISELYDKIIYDGVNYFSTTKKNIVLHIRNVNEQDVCFDSTREYYNDKKKDYFFNLIKNIFSKHGDEFEVHIFSQGMNESFRIFEENFDSKLHINDGVIQTFHHMMNADIFITSNSSLSWCAHLFGKNNYVYSRPNFTHSWYDNTYSTDINGKILN